MEAGIFFILISVKKNYFNLIVVELQRIIFPVREKNCNFVN